MKTQTHKVILILLVVFILITLSGCKHLVNGEIEYFHDDGTLEKVGTYEEGIVTKLESFHEDGSLNETGLFDTGVLTNVVSRDEDGLLNGLVVFNYGTRLQENFYDEDGNWISTKHFNDGILSHVDSHSKNKTTEQSVYYEDGIVSKIELYYEDGTIKRIYFYNEGILKRIKSYTEDGTLEQDIQVKNYSELTEELNDKEQLYRVQLGDTLSTISEKFYGTDIFVKNIKDRNSDSFTEDEGKLLIGRTLTIPEIKIIPSDDFLINGDKKID